MQKQSDFQDVDQFIPKQKPLTAVVKKPIVVNVKKTDRKWVSILFFGSFIVCLFLWMIGNKDSRPEEQITIPDATKMTSTPVPMKVKTAEIEMLKNLVSPLKGTYGVYVYNLTTRESFGFSEDEVFPPASIMKLPVLITLYREAEAGRIDLETKYVLKAADKQSGAGSMFYKPAGTVYTYRKMAELMGQLSDNTAYMVLRGILGDDLIQKTINALGMTKTNIVDYETSPLDIGLLLKKLYSGSILSRQNRDELLGYITRTFDESRIPAGVPVGIKVAHKVGTDTDTISDAGIVFADKPYIVVLMSKEVSVLEAQEILPKLSAKIWEFESQ